MNKQELFKEIGLIDESLIQEADVVMKIKFFKKTWVKIASLAACFALIMGIGIPLAYNHSNKIDLSELSNNVSTKYVKKAPNLGAFDLEQLSEKELFSKYNTSIFKGNILKIDNIEINFNSQKEYWAIAQIKVEKVYRGNCKVGDTVSVLLPCPISNNMWVEDTETVSAMKAGMTGIFMPIEYNETSFYEANGARLALKDIADYGFRDGVRYAFLETKDNIIFPKWAYKSIENATTLEEIEDYIEKMIK